jgi:Tol biopolymer transport system component
VTGDKDSLLYPGELVFGSNDRYVFFASAASNLVSGDTNNYFDIFVRDQQSGTTSRVSVQGPGFEGDNASMMPFLSDGAAYVAYVSYATNIVPVGNGTGQVYVRNVATGGTTLASVSTGGAQGDQRSFQPCVSADGRFVAFNSDADNLVPSDNNGTADVFFRDQQAGTTTRVNVGWNGAQSSVQSATVAMSSDGRYVAFDSPDPLVQGDTNSDFDVFVRDLQAGTIARASLGSSAAQGNGPSSSASLSADGRNVAFLSSASNLVSGDTNGAQDIFVRNLQAATTTRVSVATGGAQANGNSDSPNISPDGRYVAFTSAATNLVPGDTNGTTDIFVRDLQTGTTSRESVDSNGLQANGSSSAPAISRGGRFVVFVSAATNLVPGDTNAVSDVFLRDRLTGRTSRVSVNTAGTQGDQASEVYSYYGPPSVSTDGRLVVFDSWATNFAADDTNGVSDVFLRDRGNDAVFAPFCFGDGTGAACPCGNSGAAGHGCQNSAGTGGAILTGSGTPSLAADTVHFTSSGELPTSTSVLLSGPTPVNPVNYGDGLRCVGGTLKRLYTHSAAGGVVTMPQGTDLSVSARSAAQGDPLSVGSTRIYQVYYRDPSSTYCASPTGGTFNISNALAVVWGP